eukprot:2313419-Pleurochrysis_carterae.AAC.1
MAAVMAVVMAAVELVVADWDPGSMEKEEAEVRALGSSAEVVAAVMEVGTEGEEKEAGAPVAAMAAAMAAAAMVVEEMEVVDLEAEKAEVEMEAAERVVD